MSELNELLNGTESAFEDVYNRFHQRLYFFFFKHTMDRYLAEELVQETFVKLWKYRSNLSTEHTVSEQIFRIAKTRMIDALRKSRNEQRVLKQMEQDQLPHQSAGSHKHLDLSDQLRKGIHAMPSMQQKVFLLSRYEGFSNKEIADHLSISPKTVERHITKALRSLREVITDPV